MSAVTVVDPARLAAYVFGHDLWSLPEAILRETFKPRARVAVKSCHASSKTHTAADAVLIALLLGGDVITTAPTWIQVEQVLFGAVHRAIASGRIPLEEWGSVNRTEIRLATGEFALGLSTDQAIRFQGYHAREGSFLLVVLDEAPGVRAEIYTAIEGIRAGGDVRLLYIGNPVISSGPFYEIFSGADPGWYRATISAFDTPNLAGLTIDSLLALPEHDLDNNERPYLITRRFVYEKYHEWGPDHYEYQSRVLGRFPAQSDDALISLTWLEEASEAARAYAPEHGPLTAGIDVAGPGEDETVVVVTQGKSVLSVTPFAQPDARGPVLNHLRLLLHRGLSTVNIDEIGQGWYFLQHLKSSLPSSVTVRGINVGESPTSDAAAERYANLKAELYWGLRERFRDGDVVGLADQTLFAQLAGLRYDHDARGRVVIEGKDKARKRGVRSPDRAEALMLALAPPDPRQAVRSAYRAKPDTSKVTTPLETMMADRRRLFRRPAAQSLRGSR